jgi:6-phosphofructokinase 2
LAEILTLTLNPALDLSATTDAVVPGPKLRLTLPLAEPGGGGVNVSRAVAQLGGTSRAAVALAGPTGAQLQALLAAQGLDVIALDAPGETRWSLAVTEAGGAQYRFVLPGPDWHEGALSAVAARIDTEAADRAWVVLSGSMPPGVPAGWATDLARVLGAGRRLVVDTSGPALDHLSQGPEPAPCLLRMDSAEARALSGAPLGTREESAGFADTLRAKGAAEIVVIARGDDGSVMATPQGRWHVTAAGVTVVSAIGAGDSFVAGMVRALADGGAPEEALRHGAAAASAAVMTDGTQLCRAEDFAACLPRCILSRL